MPLPLAILIGLLIPFLGTSFGALSVFLLNGRSSERLERLLRYIRENLDQPLQNSTLAEIFYTHPTHFVRAFREETGQTPAKYVRNMRLETAKRLLEETDLSAAQVALRVGYPDPAHFSRLFRQRYGMPPAVWREYFEKSLIP